MTKVITLLKLSTELNIFHSFTELSQESFLFASVTMMHRTSDA